jgi:O-methyltransferase involved in polyketide biosynthesis
VFAPIDFESMILGEGLASAGFDRAKRTVASWSGVSLYLSPEAVQSTLTSVTALGAGTELVMDYCYPDNLVDDVGQRFYTTMVPLAEELGEPLLGRFSPKEIADLVEGCGLTVTDHAAPEVLRSRYFRERRDGLWFPGIGAALTAVAH